MLFSTTTPASSTARVHFVSQLLVLVEIGENNKIPSEVAMIIIKFTASKCYDKNKH